MNRWRAHGSVQVFPPELTHADLGLTDNPYGFGYRDDSGELTHFIRGDMKDGYGPFRINAIAYQDRKQLLELLALIKNLSDQLYVVVLIESFHLQLQDLLVEPFKGMNTTNGSKYVEINRAEAFWQLRINDLIVQHPFTEQIDTLVQPGADRSNQSIPRYRAILAGNIRRIHDSSG